MDLISHFLNESKLKVPELVEQYARRGVEISKQALYQAIEKPPESIRFDVMVAGRKIAKVDETKFMRWIEEHYKELKK